jgi:CcmD family protein
MYQFLVENTLYVVLIIVLIIWFGIAFYIFRMERNLKRIEKIIENDNLSEE